MSDDNGQAVPAPLLAGHLVIYGDAVAFRPDGGGDGQVIRHQIGRMFRETLLHALTTADLGPMGPFLKLDSPGALQPLMNRHQRRAAKKVNSAK